MNEAPSHLKDSADLLTADGFATGNVWYHGTSSSLVSSIQSNGLKRSGDKAMKKAAKSTMATIGNSYTESVEPVFLTQSKELAYYWAQQTVRERNVRFEEEENAVVFVITLPEEQNKSVRPDVGAASLLMIEEGEEYMAYVAKIYQDCNAGIPDIDLMKASRLEYLNKLGMAYIDKDIDAGFVSLVSK
ncbi:MAG: hypothetical protein A6F70_04215 [Cycloclasticus sp. symbiont of Bathymodiolus heckerae]|nr:MAG: hypothetical protein A6F70_04215 [Cycloclasticus sp. symbiont of Bathymodiolus heckerae]